MYSLIFLHGCCFFSYETFFYDTDFMWNLSSVNSGSCSKTIRNHCMKQTLTCIYCRLIKLWYSVFLSHSIENASSCLFTKSWTQNKNWFWFPTLLSKHLTRCIWQVSSFHFHFHFHLPTFFFTLYWTTFKIFLLFLCKTATSDTAI